MQLVPSDKRSVVAVFDLSFHQLLIRAGACILITSIHGFVLAGLTRGLGDRGPQSDGRLTINPIDHLDVLGAATMILFQLGWIRPIAIDPSELRLGRLGLVVCVFGSIATTLAAVVLLLGLRFPALKYMPEALVPSVIATLNNSVEMCIWFAAFNLLPSPPLTGMHLIVAVRPSLAKTLTKYSLYAAIALTVLLVAGVVQPLLLPVWDAVAGLLPRL
jgi:Zn-dependent protease